MNGTVNEARENCIIVDWLSFTVLDEGVEPYSLIEFLGLPSSFFISRSGIQHGYSECLFFDNISINYNGRSDMGINVTMTGSGCRTFESFSSNPDFVNLIMRLYSTFNHINITRFDLAYDDYENMIKLNKVKKSVIDLKGVYSPARVKSWNINLSNKGLSVYVGSPKSEMLVRFYDKAAERGVYFPWIRCELQMRHAVAERYVREFISTDNLSNSFFSILNNYCQFVKDKNLKNAGRSELQPWFKKWTSTRNILRYHRAPKEYNLEKTKNFVENIMGNSLQLYLSVFGYFELINNLNDNRPIEDLPPKYKNVLIDYVKQNYFKYKVYYIEKDDYFEMVDTRPIKLLELIDKLQINLDELEPCRPAMA